MPRLSPTPDPMLTADADVDADATDVMTKDHDFIRLLDEQGPPPQVLWLRLGNCSNAALQEGHSTTLLRAMDHLRDGEPWVEIRPRQASAA